MRNRTKVVLAVILVAVAAVGGVAWYLLKDDAPPPVALSEGCTVDGVDGVSGRWIVESDAPTVVGYRVQEVLAGVSTTGAGRTSNVTGSVVVDGSSVTSAEFTVDMTTLRSDESRRDSRLRTDGLQTDRFPEASFTLAGPLDLGGDVEPCSTVSVDATGDLTLHGETRSVTIPLQARVTGTPEGPRLEVTGSLEIQMADFGIDPPNIANFVSVEDHGILELQLFLSQT